MREISALFKSRYSSVPLRQSADCPIQTDARRMVLLPFSPAGSRKQCMWITSLTGCSKISMRPCGTTARVDLLLLCTWEYSKKCLHLKCLDTDLHLSPRCASKQDRLIFFFLIATFVKLLAINLSDGKSLLDRRKLNSNQRHQIIRTCSRHNNYLALQIILLLKAEQRIRELFLMGQTISSMLVLGIEMCRGCL